MISNLTHTKKRPDVAIVLNPAAGGGTAVEKWSTIREAILPKFGMVFLDVLNGSRSVQSVVARRLNDGCTRFVAAGGDGTVNALVQALMTVSTDQPIQFGAIALGSSNDFHKPVNPGQQISGISCRCDFEMTGPRDVGVLTFEDDSGRSGTRYWIINAGLGITADANALFNEPDAVLGSLKRRWTAAAILYASLRTIARYHTEMRAFKVASLPWISAPVTNLGIAKSPHFSGNFCYDSPFDPANGRFHVHLCIDMSLSETLRTLWQLAHHTFVGLPHTRSWQTNRLLVAGDRPFHVEYDGEILRSRRIAFSLADRRLEVCI